MSSEKAAQSGPVNPESVWRALMRANQLLNEAIDERLEEAGEPGLLWLEVTDTLARLPGHRLRQRDLAALLPLSPSGLSRLLDRMEEHELIRRESSPGDRRGADVILTDAGARSVEQSKPLVEAVLSEHLLGALGENAEQVRAGLRQVVSSLQGGPG